MKNQSKSATKRILLTGSVVATSLFGFNALNANPASLLDYQSLGSGAQVRSVLLDGASASNAIEMKCGNGAAKSTGKHEAAKGKDHKCGEGKCGDNKKGKDSSASKSADHKCGSGH